MKGLFVKDLLIIRTQFKTILMICLCGVAMSFAFDSSIVAGYLGIIGTMLAIGTIGYDEFDNGFSFLFTLPAVRRTYVREKYLFCLLTAVISVCAGFAISLVLSLVTPNPVSLSELLLTGLSMLMVGMLFIAFMIPVRVKYNAEKSRTFMYILYAAILVTVFGGGKILSLIGVDFSQSVAKLDSMNPYVILVIIAAIVIAGVLISERIAERIITKKEF